MLNEEKLLRIIIGLVLSLILIGCKSTTQDNEGYEVHVYHGAATAKIDMPRYDKGVTYKLLLYIREPKDSAIDSNKAINMLSRLKEWGDPYIERVGEMKSRVDLSEQWQIDNYDYVLKEGYLVEIYDDDIVVK
ncbi:hypothetical protein [Vibrio mimicus]|uniref:hypothetical protein n=1 Tax=Vibrio mimicus TaxID=674 RepID=UPI000511743B|nr:hypothetical protein [Vibrio mimicus]